MLTIFFRIRLQSNGIIKEKLNVNNSISYIAPINMKKNTNNIIILFNKPYLVVSQFTGEGVKKTLAEYIKIPGVYPAGRLDYDSEGLLVLTNSGALQNKISSPEYKLPKTYLAQVENEITEKSLDNLRKGVLLKDGLTKPASVRKITPPDIWERFPPIRERKNIPVSWLEIKITEGKNRQVRRMCALVGNPVLRLIRFSVGNWSIENIKPGEYKIIKI